MDSNVGSVERFRPPIVTAHEIVRLRLLDRLTAPNALGAAQCTLVSGPAGFGKTTLLAQAYRQVIARGDAAIWLDCTKQDADPSHFLDSLYGAAAGAGLDVADPTYTTGDLARRMVALGPLAHLFLDDFERLIGSPAEQLVERLLLLLPESTHVVLGSRQRPHAWYLERELQGLASTIDPGELRLTNAELTALLGERFTSDEVTKIERLTEGWPVAVQMTRLRAGVATPTPDIVERLVRDGLGLFNYLAERVLESLTSDERAFLRDTAILSFISPRSVNALMGRDDGFALISGVLRLQPIVTVTSDPELTIRLHPMFRQHMRNELAMLGHGHEDELQRRAARLFAARGRTLDAMQFALQADDLPLAVRLFDEAGGEVLIFTLGPRKVQALLAILPATARALSVRLRLAELVMAAVEGRASVVEELEAQFAPALAESGIGDRPAGIAPGLWPHWRAFALGLAHISKELLTDLYGGCDPGTLVRCLATERLVRARFATAEAYLGFVLALEVLLNSRYGSVGDAAHQLTEYASLCERNHFAPNLPSINPQRGLLAFLAGNFEEAIGYLARPPDKQVDRFAEPEVLLAQMSKALLALMHYERDDVDAARALIDDLVVHPNQTLPEIFALAQRVRVLCLEVGGDPGAADVVLRNELKEARHRDSKRLVWYLRTLDWEIRVRRGESGGAHSTDRAELLSLWEAELVSSEPSWLILEQGARAAVLGLVADGEVAHADDLASRFGAVATARGHRYFGAIGRLLMARTADAAGAADRARRHLATALEVSAPNRLVRPYLDLVPQLAVHLVHLSTERSAPGTGQHIRDLLRRMEATAVPKASLWNVLSERERDILTALASHSTTKAIARTLGLSPETVKHHLKRIFGKLGVHSREQALQRVAALDD